MKALCGISTAPKDLHPLLALFLFLQEFPFSRDVTAVALGRHVLPEGRDGGPGDDLPADGALDGDLELVPRYLILQLVADLDGPIAGPFLVDDDREGVDLFPVHQDVKFHEVAVAIVDEVVVEGPVALRDALQAVVENRR